MIIKSISLKDFQCYFGSHEDNFFEFSDGINFIIGDNGAGKSKLYDAFYWVLYDRIFNTDTREFVYTNSYKESLVSDNAKDKCSINEEISCEVILIVKDSRDTEYKITRIYRSKKTGDRTWDSSSTSKLIINEFKVTRWQVITPELHDSVLQRVLPNHLKPYMWFQGEQVDSLMDFKDKSSLMQAINLLSDISDYDDIIDITSKGSEKASANFTKAANKLSRNKTESENLDKQIKSKENDIKDLKEQIKSAEKNKNIAQVSFDELVNQIDDAKRKEDLKRDQNETKKKLEILAQEQESLLTGFTKKMFSDAWVLRSAKPFINEFSKKYDAYYKRHIEIINSYKNTDVKLPINIPQPIHVTHMLTDEKCFVCGRVAKKGSKEYEHIESLLSRENTEPEEIFKNDCSALFQNLYNNSLGYDHIIKNIDKNIGKELSTQNSIKIEINQNKAHLKEIEKQFDELVATDRSEDIVKEFKTHQGNIERFTEEISRSRKQLDYYNNELEKLKTKSAGLVSGNVDPVTSLAKDIFANLQKISISTREDVFSNLVDELETSANTIFQRMTSTNESITGRLKLKMLSHDSCIPEIVDKDGIIMTGSNDSNIILVKLALIMAVVTSKNSWSTNYCLISDAPTSKMSKKYSNGFYEALGDQFSQSIVMTYDYISAEDRSLLKHFIIGKTYTLQSEYPGGDRENRSDLRIKITEVSS